MEVRLLLGRFCCREVFEDELIVFSGAGLELEPGSLGS